VINNLPSWVGTGNRWELKDQAESIADDCILQADKCSEHAATESRKRSGMWWIDRILIILAAALFIMTVTAQLCIYLNKL